MQTSTYFVYVIGDPKTPEDDSLPLLLNGLRIEKDSAGTLTFNFDVFRYVLFVQMTYLDFLVSFWLWWRLMQTFSLNWHVFIYWGRSYLFLLLIRQRVLPRSLVATILLVSLQRFLVQRSMRQFVFALSILNLPISVLQFLILDVPISDDHFRSPGLCCFCSVPNVSFCHFYSCFLFNFKLLGEPAWETTEQLKINFGTLRPWKDETLLQKLSRKPYHVTVLESDWKHLYLASFENGVMATRIYRNCHEIPNAPRDPISPSNASSCAQWAQHSARMVPAWSQQSPKSSQDGVHEAPKWSQNGAKMGSRRRKNQRKTPTQQRIG